MKPTRKTTFVLALFLSCAPIPAPFAQTAAPPQTAAHTPRQTNQSADGGTPHSMMAAHAVTIGTVSGAEITKPDAASARTDHTMSPGSASASAVCAAARLRR
jgi:hypothetical protein